MKIIFLDIDGVLVTGKYSREQYAKKEWSRDEYGDGFDVTAVAALRFLIAETGAKLVISSTWRHSGLKAMQEMWLKRELPGEIIDITPSGEHRFRGLEIDTWLREAGLWHANHSQSSLEKDSVNSGIESYLIIDDDSDMLLNQLNHFVNTDFEVGLTKRQAIKGANRLNNGFKGYRPFRSNEK